MIRETEQYKKIKAAQRRLRKKHETENSHEWVPTQVGVAGYERRLF
mgnify:CR=1 FL=1